MNKTILKIYFFKKEIAEINCISKKETLLVFLFSLIATFAVKFLYTFKFNENEILNSVRICSQNLFESFGLCIIFYLCFLFVYSLFYSYHKWFELLKEIILLNFIRPIFLLINQFIQNFFFDLLFPIYAVLFLVFFLNSYVQEENRNLKKSISIVLISSLIFITITMIYDPLILISL